MILSLSEIAGSAVDLLNLFAFSFSLSFYFISSLDFWSLPLTTTIVHIAKCTHPGHVWCMNGDAR